MKQTAVEWLINELIRIGYFEDINPNITFEQAKEMEKQQQGYSEEDMEIAFGTISTNWICFKEFIEQFKNK